MNDLAAMDWLETPLGRAVLELSDPRMSASGLTYDARVVDGIVPGESGACVLFLEWQQSAAPGVEARGVTRVIERVARRCHQPKAAASSSMWRNTRARLMPSNACPCPAGQ